MTIINTFEKDYIESKPLDMFETMIERYCKKCKMTWVIFESQDSKQDIKDHINNTHQDLLIMESLQQ